MKATSLAELFPASQPPRTPRSGESFDDLLAEARPDAEPVRDFEAGDAPGVRAERASRDDATRDEATRGEAAAMDGESDRSFLDEERDLESEMLLAEAAIAAELLQPEELILLAEPATSANLGVAEELPQFDSEPWLAPPPAGNPIDAALLAEAVPEHAAIASGAPLAARQGAEFIQEPAGAPGIIARESNVPAPEADDSSDLAMAGAARPARWSESRGAEARDAVPHTSMSGAAKKETQAPIAGGYFAQSAASAAADASRVATSAREHRFFLLDDTAPVDASAPTPFGDAESESGAQAPPRAAQSTATLTADARSALPLRPADHSPGSHATPAAPAAAASNSQEIAVDPLLRGRPLESARADAIVRTAPGEEAAFARRIYQQVRRALVRGESEVKLRLDPPQLGRVDVAIRVHGTQVDLAFRVDDEQVRGVISRHVEELEAALERYGYDANQVSVDLRDAGGGHARDRGGDDQLAEPLGMQTGGKDATPRVEEEEVALSHLGLLMDLRG